MMLRPIPFRPTVERQWRNCVRCLAGPCLALVELIPFNLHWWPHPFASSLAAFSIAQATSVDSVQPELISPALILDFMLDCHIGGPQPQR